MKGLREICATISLLGLYFQKTWNLRCMMYNFFHNYRQRLGGRHRESEVAHVRNTSQDRNANRGRDGMKRGERDSRDWSEKGRGKEEDLPDFKKRPGRWLSIHD